MVQFNFESTEGVNNKVLYDSKEKSLFTIGQMSNCSLAIENTYLTLDFDMETKKINGISGFLGEINLFKRGKARLNKIHDSIVLINSEQKFNVGVAYNFDICSDIFYDRENNMVYLENKEKIKIITQYFRVARNLYFACKQNELIGIYIHLEEEG